MKLVIGLVILWLLIYNDAELFRLLHSSIVGVLQ